MSSVKGRRFCRDLVERDPAERFCTIKFFAQLSNTLSDCAALSERHSLRRGIQE
jgi:hypothetical protein